jgi:FdhD protein
MSEGYLKLPVQRILPDGQVESFQRSFPEETPICIEYNGISYAVMMGTPTDLRDFAFGFSLSERIVEFVSQITDVKTSKAENGWLLRITIDRDCFSNVMNRVRNRVSEGSCGLCGLESLEQVAKPLPKLDVTKKVSDEAIFAALSKLRSFQPLNNETGGAHAAAFFSLDAGHVFAVREDVGRHNALDKLIGALAVQDVDASTGFIIVTARCSYELVEKTVIANCGNLVSISVATDMAISKAKACGLNLVSLARPDAFLRC